MKITLSILCIAFGLQLSAQNNLKIQWGSREKYRGSTERIVNINNQNFTVVINRRGFLSFLAPNAQKLVLREVNNMNPAGEKKVQLRAGNRNLSASDVTGLGKDLITLSQRQRGISGQNEMFTHIFDPSNAGKRVEGNKIISYSNWGAPTHLKQLGLIQSEDFTKVAAYYTIPVRQGQFPGFGCVVYDQTGAKSAEFTTQLPYQTYQIDFYDAFLSNSGDFYALAREYYIMNQSQVWSPNNRTFAKLRAFKAIDGKFSEFEINQNGFIIHNMQMSTDEDGNFTCSGFYADDIYSGVRGVFLLVLDRKTNAVISVNKQPFTAEFINTGIAAWEQNWRDRNRANMSRNQGLSDFRVLEFRKTADKGFVVIAENQSMELRARVTGTGDEQKITYTEYYYRDDIIVYKLDEKGTLLWVKRIAKNQQSIKDGGYYLSTAVGITSNKVYLFFNDNRRNYQENGDYITGQFPFAFNHPQLNHVIASVEVDLATGDFKRSSQPGANENKVVLVPNKCVFNWNANEFIFYGQRNNKHRFGHLRLM